MNYRKDIVIDETALDVEWLDQPRLMLKYAQHATLMRLEMDKAEESLEITKADLDKDIRMNPASYDIVKITEPAVKGAILKEDLYKQGMTEFLQAKYEHNMAQAAVKAFEQRKDALENLVRLHGQQYFAGPRVPRDLSWERKEKQKRRDAEVASKSSFKRNRHE